MTKVIGNITVIAAEDDSICQLCGKTDETRPYGPGFKRICFDCGEKDPLTTKRMNHKLFGDPITAAEIGES